MTGYFPQGIITATVTPMDRDLNPDNTLMVSHIRQLLSDGSNGMVLLGTTGEANSFSVNERQAILDHIVKEDIAPASLMVGTGCCAISDTITLTRHAIQCGVKNVLVLPPFYYKPVSDTALLEYYSRVIDTIADDHLQVYLYHFPKNTGIDLSVNLISALIARYPNQVVGIKDSGGDWRHMQLLLSEFPSFRLYCGTEEFFLDTLKAGGAGCISATANITVPYAARVFQAFNHGEDAETKQQLLTAMRHVFMGYSFVGAVKGYLAMTSANDTWNYLRPPNEVLPVETITAIFKKLQQLKEPIIET